MLKAPIPKNEPERLKALKSLKILDTPPEERLDRITEMALHIFHVPISTISIVDENREWFKSCKGLPAHEGERAISFCGHAMFEDEFLIIPDAKADPRFFDNPMVIGPPHIRFYAGVPIKTIDRQPIGTFCIKDTKPRKINLEQIGILKSLAKWAEVEINNHNINLALKKLKEFEKSKENYLESLAVTMSKLKDIDNIKDEFISLASHQLRTPASGVKAYLSMLVAGDAGKLTPKQLEFATKAYSGNEQTLSLVDHLLNIARIESGRFELVKKSTDLTGLIQNLVNQFSETFKKRQQTLKFNQPDQPIKAFVDEEKLRMVFSNLIDNASKYSPQGGKIELTLEESGKKILIHVKDVGVGIAKKDIGKLFQKMSRIDNPLSAKSGGTGLGLYIAKKIVELHEGEIKVYSTTGKGTEFVVILPYNKKK